MPRPRRIQGLEVDERDLQIIRILEEDARIPWRQLARRIGVSEATIYSRVRKLIERGIIKSFSARVDPERLGLRFHAFVLMKVKMSQARAMESTLKGRRYVYRLYHITGHYNYLMEVYAPTQEELLEIINDITRVSEVDEVLIFSTMRKVWEASSIIADLLGFDFPVEESEL